MDAKLLDKFLREIRLLRQPKKLLSTFGATRIEYTLVSPVEDLPNRTRLREGLVVSERPKVLTPDTLKDRFEGFGSDARDIAQWLSSQYSDILRVLEYRFKNHGLQTRVLGQGPRETALRILRDLEGRDAAQTAVIECPDAAWSLALIKLTIEEAARSFPVNVRDCELRGFFDPVGAESRRRTGEIDVLFERARSRPETRESLRRKLVEYGVFDQYEDRFLALYR